MGKRERRRKRQRVAAAKRHTANRFVFPTPDDPLVEVLITKGTPDDLKAVCLAYWQFSEPGTWAQNVAAIGPSAFVSQTAKAYSRAALLTVHCPECASPATVANRSEMAATGYWRADVFPQTDTTAKTPCADCQAAAAAARKEEAARAREAQEASNQKRVETASDWVASHRDITSSNGELTVSAALAVLAIGQIMERTNAKSFGPIKDIDYTLAGSSEEDIFLLRMLHRHGWMVPTLPATIGDFDFNDDDTVEGVYVDRVPWRFAYWLGDDEVSARAEAADAAMLLLFPNHDLVEDRVKQFEAEMLVDYINGLLDRKYREDPIPEHRLEEAYLAAYEALDAFTLEGLISIAWSAASRSVAWGQRTPGLKAGSVAAATVTNFGKGIEYARIQGARSYDPPNWLARPAMRETALRFLEAQGEAIDALHRFREVQQQVNEAPWPPVDTDAEEEAADEMAEPFDVDAWLDDLRNGVKRPPTGPQHLCAIVSKDGALSMRSITVKEMREIAGQPYGMADRLMLERAKGLHAYIAEGVSADLNNENPVAARMLDLLDQGSEPAYGTVLFFQVDMSNRPVSLDSERQELVTLAHQVARNQTHQKS